MLAVFGISIFTTAHAEGATVSQSGGAVNADCAGGTATVNGSGNAITFHNACQTLTVNGSGNTIQIELNAAGSITLNGAGNRISYTPLGGTGDVAVTDHGQGNAVVHLAAAPGGTATVTGNAAVPGGSLSVQGPNGESVQFGPNGIVATPGASQPGNQPPSQPEGAVTINPGGMAVTTPNGSAVVASASQLTLSGDHQNQDVSCSSVNVYISGDKGHFTLRGGCKALFLRGDHNIVHAELTPGAQIAIQGDNTLVYVRLTEAGPNPTLLITGDNSRVILVQHIDDTTGTELPATVRKGALPDSPASTALAAVGAPVAILTPQAALTFAKSQSLEVLQRDLGVQQTPQGAVVNLSGDVLFDFDQDHLRPDARRSLAELAVLIDRTHPHGLRIVGYTDSVGTPQYNLDLSDRRARNVEHWLLDYGRVQITALNVEGRGAAEPVAPNALPDGRDNPDGRQRNRRVEVLLQQ